jgi:hypothetical protein
MAKPRPEQELAEIEAVVRANPGSVTAQQIAAALKAAIPLRTLQYRLKHLVDTHRLARQGTGRWAKYRLPPIIVTGDLKSGDAHLEAEIEVGIPLSKAGAEVQAYVRQPAEKRKPVGYDRAFLDSYRPNVSAYLDPGERAHLLKVGTAEAGQQPAGTYAKQILNRLLIDLSWNSSRLEGNTYSLLDTKRLIDFGEEAEGKERLEAQMILNHKDAIEFLVGSAPEIGFNRYTILNLHAMLANNLLADEAAAGRLRRIAVGIEKSAFHPLEVPQLIEECFDQILATAAAIEDPFEQSFFVMVQLPYLQPFDDVNKRVSRLAANIPLIKGNLSPLSFTDVPRSTYTDAMLGVYEMNRIDLLRNVFMWAYERSAARYAAVRQSLGEPDPFRLRYRAALREIVGSIVRERMNRKTAAAHISSWVSKNIDDADHDRFREIAEGELLSLHEGNFARYQITPSEFESWQQQWTAGGT